MRLGNSGLKVSQIILGTLQYGHKGWQEWALDEQEAIQHIKVACVSCSVCDTTEILLICHTLSYELGIQTFDTANCYSNGLSEIILGKATKQLQLPREEIVIMTKVRTWTTATRCAHEYILHS